MQRVTPEAEKRARYQAFWSRAEVDRPLIGATIGTFPSHRAVRGEGILEPADLDLEENLAELEEEWEQWRDTSGDAVWTANPVWAFPWYQAMAGCVVERQGDSIWHLPGLEDWDSLDALHFDPSNPWFQRKAEFVRALVAQARGRYPVGVGQIGGGPDLMMQLRGPDRLGLDLHDSPQMVAALGERCVSFCSDTAEALYSLVPPYMGGHAGTIRYFWAPGKLVESSEDVSFMMSPAAHRRFLVPLHAGLGKRLPYNIIHVHSTQLHTIGNLLEVPEIGAIEITPDFGEDMLPHLPILGEILERKPLLVHGIMTVEAVKQIMGALPSRGLALFCRCSSAEEAGKLLSAVL